MVLDHRCLPDVTSQNYAFSPTDENTQPFFRTTKVNVWAVHDYLAVPEPNSMGLAGLALVVVAVLAFRLGAAKAQNKVF